MNALWLLFPAAAKFGLVSRDLAAPRTQKPQNAKNAKTPRTPKRQERRNAKNAETPTTMIKTATHDNEDLWVFAYGSLMWRPGFSYLERVPARLVGLHRALCVFSFFHRGTPERPGLVLGLDRGGMCRGIAYRVGGAARAQTLRYLREREQVTTVYLETMRQIELEDQARRRVRAVCYLVDRSHVQYAGRLTLAESLHHIRQGHGHSGANRDYVLETVRALEALGYRESDLHLLAQQLAGSEVRSEKSAIGKKSEIRKPGTETGSVSVVPEH
jgi:glutathione-specific gamma-glutamylcyclotransferase